MLRIKMYKKLVMLNFISLLLVGCNTMEGVGKDVKGAGNTLENAAHKNKRQY